MEAAGVLVGTHLYLVLQERLTGSVVNPIIASADRFSVSCSSAAPPAFLQPSSTERSLQNTFSDVLFCAKEMSRLSVKVN